MKCFDLHADIGYDIMQKKRQGIQAGILDRFHVTKFQTGEIGYLCMASYFDGSQDWTAMQDMILSVREEIDACECIDLALTKNDLLQDNGHIKAIMSVEGMCGIQDAVKEKIAWMWEKGVRLASFCWNEENALATGVRGNPKRGLTDLGKQALQEMVDRSMIVDVSHANEQTFWDILKEPKAHIIASHSNVRALCDHPRNLKKEQILALVNRGTLIGMNSAPQFVDPQPSQQDIPHLVTHMRWLKEVCGSVEAIAFGFDFMDFYEDQTHYTSDLHDCTQAQHVITEMRQYFSCDEVRKIAYQNAVDYFAKVWDE